MYRGLKHIWQNAIANHCQGFLWQFDLLERVHAVTPVEDVEELEVDPHRDGKTHDSQGDGRHHSDDAELKQGQQAHDQPGQHHARPLHVLPVDQVHHWGTEYTNI